MSDVEQSTDGMIDYDKNSTPQRHSIQSRAEQVRKMADKVSATSDEINIVDYGCGTGENAILAVRPSIESFAKRYPDHDIYIQHVDQIENDWNTLFKHAAGSDGYVGLAPYIRPTANVGSFYSHVTTKSSVDVGTSFGASHWLSRQPHISSPGTLWFADLKGKSRDTLRRQAQHDWESFLSLRLRELRQGGRLMISTLGSIPDAHENNGTCCSGRWTYRAMYRVAESMADDRLLERKALDQFTMPLWFMTAKEAQEPFLHNRELASGFDIQRLDVAEAPQHPKDIFADLKGSPADYAKMYKGFVRSFTESTFRQSLFHQTQGDTKYVDTLLGEFYDRFESLIAEGDGKYAFELWLLTVELTKA